MKISDLVQPGEHHGERTVRAVYLSVEVLAHIGDFVERLGETLPKDEYANPAEGIWIHKIRPYRTDRRHYRTGDHRTGRQKGASLRIHPRKSYCWQGVLW